MKRYLRLFNQHSEYEEYVQSQDKETPNVCYCIDNKDVHYNREPSFKDKYLTMTATDSGDITFTYPASLPTTTATYMEYSTDEGTTWYRLYNDNEEDATITVNNLEEGDKVMWRGINSSLGYYLEEDDDTFTAKFSSTCNFNVEGNIMSLLYGKNFKNQTTLTKDLSFAYIFSTAFIESAENLILPATTISNRCYEGMFEQSSLTIPPQILPATILTPYCYHKMFNECYSVTGTPQLPATTVANHCYDQMFHGCTYVREVPEILPATTLAEYCYYQMFTDCEYITIAPELPALTLIAGCYENMFMRCQSLQQVKAMFTSTPTGQTDNWLSDVAANGIFIKNINATWNNQQIIPDGWTVQTAEP